MVPNNISLSISCTVEGYPSVESALPPPNVITYKNVLCAVPLLSSDTHKIVVTNKQSGDWLRIDYFEISQLLVTPSGTSSTTVTTTTPVSPISNPQGTSNAPASTSSSGVSGQ